MVDDGVCLEIAILSSPTLIYRYGAPGSCAVTNGTAVITNDIDTSPRSITASRERESDRERNGELSIGSIGPGIEVV